MADVDLLVDRAEALLKGASEGRLTCVRWKVHPRDWVAIEDSVVERRGPRDVVIVRDIPLVMTLLDIPIEADERAHRGVPELVVRLPPLRAGQ